MANELRVEPISLPQLGLGLFKVPAEATQSLVEQALEVGYRHFDCASAYGNETELGRALSQSGLPRDTFSVTSKAWIDELGRDEVGPALGRSLERLNLDYVDYYMIHWPAPALDVYVESFERMLAIRSDGLLRHAAVSNFHSDYLQRLKNSAGELPAINQVERHPYLQQRELIDYHRREGIATQAWAPLARAEILNDSVLATLADEEGVTASQLVLAWQLSSSVSVIPKSSRRDRLEENLRATEVTLSESTIAALTPLDRGHRVGPDPREKNAP
jgi:2,5-diketo-D-gluconate reductase A